MNNKLNEKLLWLKAKKYIDSIDGITNVSMDIMSELTFGWHRDVLSKIWADKERLKRKISLPNQVEDVFECILHDIELSENAIFHIPFENRLIISFAIVDFKGVFLSNIEWNKTYDMSILLLNPNRVIVISEDEYYLTIFDTFEGE
ncbi:hypothetical protein ACLEXA_21235 [Pseudescherichia vulneris]